MGPDTVAAKLVWLLLASVSTSNSALPSICVSKSPMTSSMVRSVARLVIENFTVTVEAVGIAGDVITVVVVGRPIVLIKVGLDTLHHVINRTSSSNGTTSVTVPYFFRKI
jgi:hypothetical protein